MGELAKVCEEIGYIFFISLGKIYVQPNTDLLGSTAKMDFLTITPDMMKKPIMPDKSSAGKSDSEKDKRGVLLHTLLDGRIKTGRIGINLDTDDSYKGEYKITKVRHILNYEGDAWDTVATLRRY